MGGRGAIPETELRVHMSNTYIYFITEDKFHRYAYHYCKIGISNNPEKRLENLQTSNARELSLELKLGPFSEQEAFNLEKKLHKIFDKYHIRGEWFKNHILTRMDLIEKYEDHQAMRREENRLSTKERKRGKGLEYD
jgi:hypothetical protein